MSTLFIIIIYFWGTFLAYKEHSSFIVKDGSFWAGRIFSPELIKKFIVEFLDMLGFSVVILCFHEL